ncbi:MAG: sigma-70 family RNA polymerase sigma factor, partial [Planctomycetota bacterium]
VAALGWVFDASAPELWRVARHLCPNQANAEDVLQATYQTVIEKRDLWDSKLRLMPWMLGILANHARSLHRDLARKVDPERLEVPPVAGPGQVAAEREFRALVEDSVGGLPAGYAEAVRPYLEYGKSPAEIATALGISANAARVRLHRGLKLLRKALPVGATLGSLSAAPQPMPAALQAALRARCLQSAQASLVSMTAVSLAPSSSLIGALIMSQWIPTLTTAVLVAAGTFWLTHRSQQSTIEDLREQIATMRVAAATPQERPLRAEPGVELVAPAERSLAGTSGPETAQAPATAALTAAEWVQRLSEAATPGEARAIAGEIYALENGLEVMLGIYSRIPQVPYRQQVLKPWVFGNHAGVLALLNLAATDPSLEVNRTGFEYLLTYAFQDLGGDPETYRAWYARFGSLELKAVMQLCSREWVQRLRSAGPDSTPEHLELMRLFHKSVRSAESLGLDLAGELLGAGFEDMLRNWIASGQHPELTASALRMLGQLAPGETYLRQSVLPIVQNPDLHSLELRNAAWDALGKPGATWAVAPALECMLKTPAESANYFSPARALAEIGDPSAIPTLIAMIVADDTYATRYGVGYFGLGKLTGVEYHESHDGAWWANWWNTNQDHLPAEIRGMSLPTVILPRQ